MTTAFKHHTFEDRRTPEAFSVPEFCRAFRVGKTFAYDQITKGRLRAVKAGSRTLIRRTDAQAWASNLPAVGAH